MGVASSCLGVWVEPGLSSLPGGLSLGAANGRCYGRSFVGIGWLAWLGVTWVLKVLG